MPIVMRLDRVMADRKISSQELAEIIGISPVNLSRIKTGRLKGIRFSTLPSPPHLFVSRTEQCVKLPAQL